VSQLVTALVPCDQNYMKINMPKIAGGLNTTTKASTFASTVAPKKRCVKKVKIG
jgi:hypothetical protein